MPKKIHSFDEIKYATAAIIRSVIIIQKTALSNLNRN